MFSMLHTKATMLSDEDVIKIIVCIGYVVSYPCAILIACYKIAAICSAAYQETDTAAPHCKYVPISLLQKK